MQRYNNNITKPIVITAYNITSSYLILGKNINVKVSSLTQQSKNESQNNNGKWHKIGLSLLLDLRVLLEFQMALYEMKAVVFTKHTFYTANGN